MNLRFSTLAKEFMPKIEYEDLILLFDTGASVPVWCGGINSFKDKFPAAKIMSHRYLLSGFGRSETELMRFLSEPNSEEADNYFADVYSLPEFALETDEGKIVWKNLNIAVTNRRFSGVQMILSYTMFGHMSIKFDQSAVNPEIIIESAKDTKYAFVKLNDNFSEEILQHIYIHDSL